MTKTYDVCRLNGFAVTLEELEEMYQVGVKGKFNFRLGSPFKNCTHLQGKIVQTIARTEVE